MSKQHKATSSKAKFSQLTRPEKITKDPGKLPSSGAFNTAQVSLISKGDKSGYAPEKIPCDGSQGGNDDIVDFIKSARAMVLRGRFKAEENAHRNMLQRAKNGKVVHPSFKSFRDFLLHVRPMPGKGMTLDRIDNDDPEYAPGKVRWADRHTQNNNKSDTLTFYYSRTRDVYTTSRLSKLQNVSPDAIRKRRCQGWTDDEIIEGKRTSSVPKPHVTKGATGAVGPASSKFPAGLYTPAQLALLSRSEKQLTSASDIMFHRDAHYQQWERSTNGTEHMLPTYEEFLELGEEFAVMTPESHKRGFLSRWGNLRPHVIYGNLLPHQKAMLAEYDPAWVACQEAKARPEQELKDHI
ncbi:hypothetical protein [Shinella zoogloeoides]|uniref:Uncharacterized protein n=1 Tax=Shinella zoogloeoides TaxID=352475 RepID=A0A6N8TIW2_SHIZO|nr:hypothetical protein [Shinella zoogloeoides]MXO01050.1 hypothetical protein [Shinella zoogloeoides]UEX80571.1 hypothetical protein K8M09_13270 [Shinella zoogloeoides]